MNERMNEWTNERMNEWINEFPVCLFVDNFNTLKFSAASIFKDNIQYTKPNFAKQNRKFSIVYDVLGAIIAFLIKVIVNRFSKPF